MKLIKKPFAFLLLAILVFSMTACGEKDQDQATMPEAAPEILEAAMGRIEDATEMDIDMTMKMDIGMMGQSMNMTTNARSLIFTDPLKAKVEATVEAEGQEGNETVTTYIGKEGDEHFIYMNLGDTWSKQSIGDIESALSTYGKQDTDLYVQNKDSFSIKETVEEDGKTYTVLTGSMPKEAVQELFADSGVGDQLGMGGLDASILEGIDLEGFALNVWVDNETVTVKKIFMDMSAFMKTIMDSVLGGIAGTLTDEDLKASGVESASDLSIDVNVCTMEVVYNKTKDVESFDIPKEALDAEVTDMGLGDPGLGTEDATLEDESTEGESEEDPAATE